MKLFVEEEGATDAEELFAALEGSEPSLIAAPDLLFPECANVFRSRVLRRLMSAEAAREAFGALRSLPLQVVPVGEFSEEALDLALRFDLSVYDGCYAALARRLGAPLITADKRLLKKLGPAPLNAALLQQIKG